MAIKNIFLSFLILLLFFLSISEVFSQREYLVSYEVINFDENFSLDTISTVIGYEKSSNSGYYLFELLDENYTKIYSSFFEKELVMYTYLPEELGGNNVQENIETSTYTLYSPYFKEIYYFTITDTQTNKTLLFEDIHDDIEKLNYSLKQHIFTDESIRGQAEVERIIETSPVLDKIVFPTLEEISEENKNLVIDQEETSEKSISSMTDKVEEIPVKEEEQESNYPYVLLGIMLLSLTILLMMRLTKHE